MFFHNFTKYIFFLILFASLVVLPPAMALAATGLGDAQTGLDDTANKGFGASYTAEEAKKGGLPQRIGQIVGAGLAFTGVIFFLLMIYGGYTWMFAYGNEQTTVKAKELIIAAVIGLIIISIAYALTVFLGGIFGQ